MITETYKLSEGQFLSEIEPFESGGLPSNCLIHKIIPGCGATTLELDFERNSIIIEPNKPVITGKCKLMNTDEQGRVLRKNKKVIGVYEGVNVPDIKNYIDNCNGYKKILTTPEGFSKVLEAIGNTIYDDYFLLFDECEKAIQDVKYREGIIQPMESFFQFKSKAFVSATMLIPSDKRFENFKLIKIEPNYDFKENITVCTTNNVVFHLKKIFDSYQSDRKFFVFFKTTRRIKNIIKGLKIEKESAVYCSDKSAVELRLNKFKNVYSDVNEKFLKYNFFTSRFFSAVDIDYKMYKCNPIIIIISDVIAVEHSIMDVHTEAIQICGRFRRPPKEIDIKVVKDIHHVSNFNTKLTNFNKSEIEAILRDKKKLHDFVSWFRPESNIDYFKMFLDEILQINGFQCFLRDGKINSFMVDNFINEERVKGYYKFKEELLKQYQKSAYFNVLPNSGYINYNLTDDELSNIKDNSSHKTLNGYITNILNNINEDGDIENNIHFELGLYKTYFPKQFALIHELGWEASKKLKFDLDKIQSQLDEREKINGLMPMIKFIQKNFEIGKFYSSKEIESILQVGIKTTNSNHCKPNVLLLKNAVELSERKQQKQGNIWVNGYIVIKFLQTF